MKSSFLIIHSLERSCICMSGVSTLPPFLWFSDWNLKSDIMLWYFYLCFILLNSTKILYKNNEKKNYVCLLDAVKRHFQQYFSYIVVVSFIGGGNRHSQKWWVLCSFTYLRWRRRDVCNFHMIYIDDIIHNCMCVIFWTWIKLN